ncbi:MAG TPA: alkaline phosphatase family protein [Verrucomicrobiae bacterium]|nr:alkaline phosphatase family protein [Verrucomicrobiae bacterium]
MRVSSLIVAALLLLLAGCKSHPENPTAKLDHTPGMLPGRKADGSVLLPNQWALHPAGRQILLRDFPVNIALHPAGRFAAILHSGFSANLIAVVDLKQMKAVSHVNIPQGFYGIQFSADGRHVFCSGAGDEVIHEFDFDNGNLVNHREIQLRDPKLRGIPAGLAVTKSGKTVYAANVWGDRVTRVSAYGNPAPLDILLRTNSEPLLPVPGSPPPDADMEAAGKRAEVYLLQTSTQSGFPYGCVLDEPRRRLYVSLWGQACVAVIDLDSNRVIARWPTQEHPCEMLLAHAGKVLFVANANRNTVTVLDTATGKPLETLWAALYPHSPPGSTPNSLALSPDEKTLFVANATLNTVAVFDVSTLPKSRSLGFIPVGWYPTSVRVTPDGKKLLVANGKGSISQANPLGPQPGVPVPPNSAVEYIAGLFRGTLSVIDLPPRDSARWKADLAKYTAEAYACSPLNRDATVTARRPASNPVPLAPGDPSPIKYVVYIIKENRTYDQVLGDMREGNGDPKLCLFPERVSRNHHKIARDFVLLDNFYADAEVSADGHEWSMGAYATDFVERMWPFNYGHGRPHKFPYPAEGNFPIASPAGGYLWDRAAAAGVTYRSYGEFVDMYRPFNEPETTRVPALKGHIDPEYRGFDLDYSDEDRADRFISELHRFQAAGEMPRLQIVRLPNDHTHGSTKGYRTPTAYVAENDHALGRIIEALSHSKFWPKMAVFVVEDDAQNGPDHVDAHRTEAFVASPFAKRHVVDSTLYSTTSLLRTIELILGLQPMSQFDAAATPMYNSFQPTPDNTPYTCLPPNVDLNARNTAAAWGSELEMNFAKEDAADDFLLNECVWRSVRGASSKMPEPIRAGFVFTHDKNDDD